MAAMVKSAIPATRPGRLVAFRPRPQTARTVALPSPAHRLPRQDRLQVLAVALISAWCLIRLVL